MPFRDPAMLFFENAWPPSSVAQPLRTLYGAAIRVPLEVHRLSSITAIDVPRTKAPSSVERWYVLILMCLIYAINIADRYVVSTVLEPIRLDLHLDDDSVGMLTSWPLALFYVTCGIPISWFADRSNRRNILSVSLIVWSGFTALCGLSRGWIQFALARIGAGIGEAGGTPPSTAIVSDCFPPARRPMAMTVLALGAPIGAWIALDVAGA